MLPIVRKSASLRTLTSNKHLVREQSRQRNRERSRRRSCWLFEFFRSARSWRSSVTCWIFPPFSRASLAVRAGGEGMNSLVSLEHLQCSHVGLLRKPCRYRAFAAHGLTAQPFSRWQNARSAAVAQAFGQRGEG